MLLPHWEEIFFIFIYINYLKKNNNPSAVAMYLIQKYYKDSKILKKITVAEPNVIIAKLPFGWLKGLNLKGRHFNGWFFI